MQGPCAAAVVVQVAAGLKWWQRQHLEDAVCAVGGAPAREGREIWVQSSALDQRSADAGVTRWSLGVFTSTVGMIPPLRGGLRIK